MKWKKISEEAVLVYFKKNLHFIILNYILNHILRPKFFEGMFYTLKYDHCYTLYIDIKFAINLDGKKYGITHEDLIAFILNPLK